VKKRAAIPVFLLALLPAVGLHGVSPQQPPTPSSTEQSKDIPMAKSEAPVQPIPYSHKKHLAFGLKCQECHVNPEPGDRMTFPSTSKCMACHATIAKDKPSIQKLAEFAHSNQPIPWVRIYVVSSWVYWNHRAHLEAKMTCEMCHGEVQEMEVMTKVSNVTTMAGCIDCHRKNDASTGCQYCHADK
jgi:class III cytochrome C family protein/cytochrome c7-like protein